MRNAIVAQNVIEDIDGESPFRIPCHKESHRGGI
jgi:hypothetical protein